MLRHRGEAPEGKNCIVTQLFLAATERVHTGAQKRGSNGTFVDASPYTKTHASKYTLEERHTLNHDTELLVHPYTPIFKDGQTTTEAELHELLRLRRMERQPDLAAHLDVIAKWLYDILTKIVNG